MSTDWTLFTHKARSYSASRPAYPVKAFDFLETDGVLPTSSAIVDVGTGTGLLAILFLQRDLSVIGVDPSLEMLCQARHDLRHYHQFAALPGLAEALPLADESTDLVAVGHAFHWFDPLSTGREFRRVLRKGGAVALLWNERRTDRLPFSVAYAQLLGRHHLLEGESLTHIDRSAIGAVFAGGEVIEAHFENVERLSAHGARARLLSSSYCPGEGDPRRERLLVELEEAFAKCQQNGEIDFDYETVVICGRPNP